MELHELARTKEFHSLEIVRGKGRDTTFERFSKYQNEFPDDLCVLLVDSETDVPDGQKVWDTVRRRDKWSKPKWATECHLYLMVQFVEAWLLTDQDALKRFFGKDFDPKGLPITNLDQRSKEEIEAALEKATEKTLKGKYRHGQAHEIMLYVRPENVKSLRDGKRLFEELAILISES